MLYLVLVILIVATLIVGYRLVSSVVWRDEIDEDLVGPVEEARKIVAKQGIKVGKLKVYYFDMNLFGRARIMSAKTGVIQIGSFVKNLSYSEKVIVLVHEILHIATNNPTHQGTWLEAMEKTGLVEYEYVTFEGRLIRTDIKKKYKGRFYVVKSLIQSVNGPIEVMYECEADDIGEVVSLMKSLYKENFIRVKGVEELG